jgi:hypothetical protein
MKKQELIINLNLNYNYMEQKFLQIVEKYNQLKNIDYISSNILNIKNIENEIADLKNNIGELKKLKISEDMSSKIQEIEQDIMKKKEIIKNLIINYDPEWYKLNMKTLNIEEFERSFTDLFIFGDKDSSSKSLILRAKYKGAPVFIKAFSSTDGNLISELQIYEYISRVEEHINPAVKSYMDDYFIRLKTYFRMEKVIFFDFLERNKIQQLKSQPIKSQYKLTEEIEVNESNSMKLSKRLKIYVELFELNKYLIQFINDNLHDVTGDVKQKCLQIRDETLKKNENMKLEQQRINKELLKYQSINQTLTEKLQLIKSGKKLEKEYEKKIYYSTKVESVFNKIPEIFLGDNMYFIVTEDIEGESLDNKCSFLSQIEQNRIDKLKFPNHEDYKDLNIYPDINPRKEIINIIFEFIYGVYLLNKYFRIKHGDLYFKNVIIKNINPINKNFIIGNTSIKKKSNIRIAIYDFDMSTLDFDKESIDKDSEDIHRIRISFNKNRYIGTTFNEISNNIALDEESNLEVILKKLIHHYSKELDIEDANPLFKKYLKYKNKYLQLKKI